MRLGSLETDPLLGVEQIIQWFFQDLPYSLQELTELIEIWHIVKKQPSIFQQLSQEAKIVVGQHVFQAETLREMRWVKNKPAFSYRAPLQFGASYAPKIANSLIPSKHRRVCMVECAWIEGVWWVA